MSVMANSQDSPQRSDPLILESFDPSQLLRSDELSVSGTATDGWDLRIFEGFKD